MLSCNVFLLDCNCNIDIKNGYIWKKNDYNACLWKYNSHILFFERFEAGVNVGGRWEDKRTQIQIAILTHYFLTMLYQVVHLFLLYKTYSTGPCLESACTPCGHSSLSADSTDSCKTIRRSVGRCRSGEPTHSWRYPWLNESPLSTYWDWQYLTATSAYIISQRPPFLINPVTASC